MNLNKLLKETKLNNIIGDKELLKALQEIILKNQINVETFLKNHNEFNKIMNQLSSQLSPKQYNKLKDSLMEIYKILQEKNEISNEIIQYFKNYLNDNPTIISDYNSLEDDNKYTYIVFILFFLVCILAFSKKYK